PTTTNSRRSPRLPDVLEIRGDGSLRMLTTGLLFGYGIEPRGVVHIGAHHGEEVPIYQASGFRQIVLVEPLPAASDVIRRDHPEVRLVQAAVASSGDRAAYFESPVSVTGGLATLAADVTMTEVSVYRADWIQRRQPGCNVLVVDTQGTELDVLRSADLDSL